MNLSAFIVALAFANASANGVRGKREAAPGYAGAYAGDRGYGQIAGGYYGNPFYGHAYHVIGKRAAAPSLAYTGDTAELTPEVAPARGHGYPYGGYGRGKRDAAPGYGYNAMADTQYAGHAIKGIKRRKRDATPRPGYDAIEEVCAYAYAYAYADCLYAGHGGAHQIGKRAASDELYAYGAYGTYGAGLGAYGGAHQIGKRAASGGHVGAGLPLGYRYGYTYVAAPGAYGGAHQIGKRAADPGAPAFDALDAAFAYAVPYYGPYYGAIPYVAAPAHP